MDRGTWGSGNIGSIYILLTIISHGCCRRCL